MDNSRVNEGESFCISWSFHNQETELVPYIETPIVLLNRVFYWCKRSAFCWGSVLPRAMMTSSNGSPDSWGWHVSGQNSKCVNLEHGLPDFSWNAPTHRHHTKRFVLARILDGDRDVLGQRLQSFLEGPLERFLVRLLCNHFLLYLKSIIKEYSCSLTGTLCLSYLTRTSTFTLLLKTVWLERAPGLDDWSL